MWSQRLSSGEQQRVALARALLMRPDWLFLDESTSAVDEKLEAELYAVLARRLPKTTIMSIGHRSAVVRLHQRHLEMIPKAVTSRCATPPRSRGGAVAQALYPPPRRRAVQGSRSARRRRSRPPRPSAPWPPRDGRSCVEMKCAELLNQSVIGPICYDSTAIRLCSGARRAARLA